MPVRYDIAAQIPQAQGGGFDPMNMMVQMQAMDYRQQQNALAQMQMQEYARKMQAFQQMRGVQANFEDPRFPQQLWSYDPETAMQAQGVVRSSAAQRATEAASRAAAKYHEDTFNLQKRQFEEVTKPKGVAETGKAVAERAGSEMKIAQDILRDPFLAHSAQRPGAFEEQYAKAYGQLLNVAPSVAKMLGPRPDIAAVERIIIGGEEFAAARKPMVRKPGEVVVSGTGRPGEFMETEPQYQPNAMAAPPVNAMAAPLPPGAMTARSDMALPADIDPIIAKAKKKDKALRQLPPGPARETAGARMDLRDTLDQIDEGFGGLADAAGITRAGASNADNWKAAFRKSPTGQAIGSLSDSETNARLAGLRTASAVLKAQLRKGLEMGITQMDAVKEMEKLDAAFLNPDKVKGLSEAQASIQVLRRMIGAESGAAQPSTPAGRGKAGEEPKATGGVVDFGSLK
jgi:hypothetical protein